jgi:ankyrin repeat protein
MNRRTLLAAALPLVLAAAPAPAQSLPLGGANFDTWYTVVTAAQRNKVDDVRALLQRGDDPNTTDGEGRTSLSYAASFGNAEMTKLLLDRGAHVDARDKFGNMPLHWAAERGHLEVMRLLIAAKPPIDAVNKQGITALMLAAGAGKVAAVRLLLENGADAKKQDFTGRDALGYAASQPQVRNLLQARKG